jgi:hypothetical protein
MHWLFLFALACATEAKEENDSAPPGINLEHDTGPEAECEPNMRVNGDRLSERGDPRVGEQWTVLMWCDNAVVQGAYVLQLNPPTLGQVDEHNPVVTWMQTGEGTIFLQSGRMETQEPITVRSMR